MTKLTYFDADTNEELHSEDLGATRRFGRFFLE